MALVLPRGEIFLWGRNFCRIILGILAALLAAKTVRNRTKRHKTFTEHCWKSSKNTETCFFTSIKTGVRLTLIRSSTTLLRSVSAYVLHQKAKIQRLIIDQKHTFWCHKLKIKPLNFSLFAKKKLVTPTNPVVQDRYKDRLDKIAFFQQVGEDRSTDRRFASMCVSFYCV